MSLIFAADIGATNSRFALFKLHGDAASNLSLTLEWERWLRGADFLTFRDALSALVQESAYILAKTEPIPIAVFAPAGPIQGDMCRISNLPWVITKQEIREFLECEQVHLINDFVAQAQACLLPEAMEMASVVEGTSKAGSPIAVVGAGTGFGKALLLDAAPLFSSEQTMMERLGKTRILPTEGGHALFPFVGADEFDYARFVTDKIGGRNPIGDTILSGLGLSLLHHYLTGLDLPAHEITANIEKQPEVLRWFSRFYGRICKNFVLDTLSIGGVCITGGMALRLPVLSHPAFVEEFHESAAQAALLKNVPVWHMRKPQAGLWGAALYGARFAFEFSTNQ